MGLIRLVKYHITCKISFLTVVLMKIQVVWNIILCQPLSGYIFLRIMVQPYSMSCSPSSHGLLHTEGDSTGFFHNFDICKSMHHYMIQIIQPTRCNSFTSLLLDIYVWLNMFRASPRPSSGAYNRTRSLWSGWSVVGRGLADLPDHDQQRSSLFSPSVKPEAPSAVVCSWRWAGRRPKHVEPHINIK